MPTGHGRCTTSEGGEDGGVDDDGAELLHEVEGEGGLAVAELVVEAAVGVEADGRGGDGEVLGEERVAEGEEGVDGVGGGASVAGLEAEGLLGEPGGLEEAGSWPKSSRAASPSTPRRLWRLSVRRAWAASRFMDLRSARSGEGWLRRRRTRAFLILAWTRPQARRRQVAGSAANWRTRRSTFLWLLPWVMP